MGIDPGGINRGRIPVTGTTKDMAERADLHSALEWAAEQKATQEPTKTCYALLIDYEAPQREQFLIIRCVSDDDHTIVARASIDEEARMIVKALNALSKTGDDIDGAFETVLNDPSLAELRALLEEKSALAAFLIVRRKCVAEMLGQGKWIGEIAKRLSADETEIAKIALTVIDASNTEKET